MIKKLLLQPMVLLSIFLATAGADEKKTGFTDIFNGTDTKGWTNPYEWGEVKVVDGEIHLAADKKFFLVTEESYADFVLELEIHLPEGKANSGVMFRCHVEPNKVFGYQAECDGSDRCWSGGLYDEGRRGWIWPSDAKRSKEKKFLEHEEESKAHFATPEVKGALKRNGWNQYRITCIGNKLKIEVNDIVTTEFEDDTDAEGPVGIQHHGEEGAIYKFRNIRIKELKK